MTEYIERESAMQIAFTSPFFSDTLMEEIKAIPAADVVPVVHARWEMKPEDTTPGIYHVKKAFCTNCGKPNKQYRPPYCPNCGAKMDEEA